MTPEERERLRAERRAAMPYTAKCFEWFVQGFGFPPRECTGRENGHVSTYTAPYQPAWEE